MWRLVNWRAVSVERQKKTKKRKGKREKDNKETYTHSYQSLYLFGGTTVLPDLVLVGGGGVSSASGGSIG